VNNRGFLLFSDFESRRDQTPATLPFMSKPYNPKDAFYQKAKAQNLRARSAFKIDEIQQRWKLVRTGDAVVDLGAAPGGFLQILAQTVGPTGKIVGIDIDAIRPMGGVVTTLQLDVFAPDTLQRIREALGRPFVDVVASDMAPKTSGIRERDEARSLELARRALEFAVALVKPGGHFLAKVFMGGDFDAFCDEVRHSFNELRIVRPEATRQRSREVYVVGFKRKTIAPSPQTTP
jgi:23S rRNA (uridine2552-2'-O)-methyltransferase